MKLTDYDALVCLQLKDNGWKCHINVTFYVCLCTDADQAKEVSFWLACMFDHHQFLALCFVMLPVGQCLFISFVMLYIFIGVSFHYENLNLMHSPYHPPQPTLPYEVSWRYVAWTLLCKHHLWWIFFFKSFVKPVALYCFEKWKICFYYCLPDVFIFLAKLSKIPVWFKMSLTIFLLSLFCYQHSPLHPLSLFFPL